MLKGVLFLAGYTARSQAYAQALVAANLVPEHVLLFGDPALDAARSPRLGAGPTGAGGGFLYPDLGETLGTTCARAAWTTERSGAESVNDRTLAARLGEIGPRAVIYSGYARETVKHWVLKLGFPLLHLHAGWLPDYRGSTTVYYSWLEQGGCAVSALILDAGIDTGPVVARRRYPAPPPGVDVDFVYDNAIRADLLVRIMRKYAKMGALPAARPQQGAGQTYYVIHPVLKHVALLSREVS